MAQPTIDPTFYRTAAEAAAAPAEQLAYVVAFDRAAQKNDRYGRRVILPSRPTWLRPIEPRRRRSWWSTSAHSVAGSAP